MNRIELGRDDGEITWSEAQRALDQLIEPWQSDRRVLLVPPDATRPHAWAERITPYLYQRLSEWAEVGVMPAVGTHRVDDDAMASIMAMYPGIPASAFLKHHHRDAEANELLGELTPPMVAEATGGRCELTIPISVSKHLLAGGGFDRIVSIGQVVPHEVMGMANHSKNLFIGCGGKPLIDATHWISALCDIDAILGSIDTPPRRLLEQARALWGHRLAPTTYVLTVRAANSDGQVVTRGLFAGDGYECFQQAAELSRRVNIEWLPQRPSTMVVNVPDGYTSLWLANKAIYRTRLAIELGGELIVLARGVRELGENETQSSLIGEFGYCGIQQARRAVESSQSLASNPGIAAHLVHGSPEGNFTVRYLTRTLHRRLSRDEQATIGFQFGDYDQESSSYRQLVPGWNRTGDRDIFYIHDPGIGLWKAGDSC